MLKGYLLEKRQGYLKEGEQHRDKEMGTDAEQIHVWRVMINSDFVLNISQLGFAR